jgi:hypothetical protein
MTTATTVTPPPPPPPPSTFSGKLISFSSICHSDIILEVKTVVRFEFPYSQCKIHIYIRSFCQTERSK